MGQVGRRIGTIYHSELLIKQRHVTNSTWRSAVQVRESSIFLIYLHFVTWVYIKHPVAGLFGYEHLAYLSNVHFFICILSLC